MKHILDNIKKNEFEHAYLIYGEEDYLKNFYKNKLKEAICGDDTMNFSYYGGKDIDIKDFIDTSQTMPFFSERRLILVEGSGLFKKSSTEVAEAVDIAPESTYFVFVEDEVDKRNKLFKTISEKGYVCEMKEQKEAELMTWGVRIFAAADKRITKSNMAYFLSKTGNDMNNIKNEADKLIDYAKDSEEITKEDIDAVCIVQIQDKVFDMVDALAMRDRDKVLRLYSDLLELKEPPMKILAIMGKQFATLYGVKCMMDNNSPQGEIADKLGIRPFFISKYISQAKGFTSKELECGMKEIAEYDYMVKSGQMEDTYAVELIIMKYGRTL